MHILQNFRLIFLPMLLLISISFAACGGGDDSGDYDGTCYNCDEICLSETSDERQDCLLHCEDCQGYSDCFGWMAAHFESQVKPMSEWESVGCP